MSAASKTTERGFTLMETLVALSIISFGALLAASVINTRSPTYQLAHASELLIADLKRARLYAEEHSKAVTFQKSDTGYEISPSAISRNLPQNVDLHIIEPVSFTLGFANLGGSLSLHVGAKSTIIRIHPVTGKVERVE